MGVLTRVGGVALPHLLVDGHCHSVLAAPTDQARFERFLTEADRPAPPGTSYADTPLGLAVRRWCGPILDVGPGAHLNEYLARRATLGPDEVRRRLLSAAGLSDLLVDTGIGGAGFVPLQELGTAAGAASHEVVRLETVAEHLAGSGVTAANLADAYVNALDEATRDSIAVKSILAYRHGFEVPPTRPTPEEVRGAARSWLTRLAGGAGLPRDACRQWRLDDPVLLRFVLWCGIDRGLTVQLHAGFGDRDLGLAGVNPALLQPLFEAAEPTGTPIVLLHCYPYHREPVGWPPSFPTSTSMSGSRSPTSAPAPRRFSASSVSWRPSARCCIRATRTACRSSTTWAPHSSGRRSGGSSTAGGGKAASRSPTRNGSAPISRHRYLLVYGNPTRSRSA